MCVLTYIPQPGGNYIFTNNRDENPKRPKALAPETYLIHGRQVTYPKDTLSGGTWIASSSELDLILLNGGHRIHKHRPPYRQSRGLVILDFHKFKDEKSFFDSYEFEGMEGFTLVGKSHHTLFQIRWDEDGKTLDYMDAKRPRIWSSVTLYTPQMIADREQWFADFLSQSSKPKKAEILNFHTTGGNGDPSTNLNMERGDLVRTLGISQIEHLNNKSQLTYHSLVGL